MGYYIDQNGQYYEGDKASFGDQDVPKRLSANYTWGGSEWVYSPSVPQRIDALQGLLALDAAGLTVAYESWANDPARTFAQKAFISKAITWKRDDPTLNAAATDLCLTTQQVDDLFRMAATI